MPTFTDPVTTKSGRMVTAPTARPRPVVDATADDQVVGRNKVSWMVILWIGAIHLIALAAPFTFTWQALVLLLVWHWLSGGVGVTLGYHRLLTHSSFKTYPAVRYVLAWFGGMSGEGSAIAWVADHRKHHALSDQEGDPHSPRDGAWWSHMLWLGWTYNSKELREHVEKWAPDMLKDRGLMFLHKTFMLWHFVVGFAMFGAGYWLGGAAMAWSFVVWGVFLRMVFVFHSTWLVNSASHMWGYRNYETTDDSRNNWLVALVAYGEGWHNNHHAYPRMAPHGHKWWEFDLTYNMIRALRLCGLAWDVVDYKTAADKK